MTNWHVECVQCGNVVQCFECETFRTERREHYQCDSCGCYWYTVYDVEQSGKTVVQEGKP